MTDYPQYPADPNPEPPPGPAAVGPRPRSVDTAVNLIWAAVALTIVSTILAFVQLDDAVDTALESDTTDTLTEDAARTVDDRFRSSSWSSASGSTRCWRSSSTRARTGPASSSPCWR